MRLIRLLIRSAVLLLTLMPARSASFAQATPVEEVVVSARRVPQPLNEVAGSISVVEAGDIQDGRATISLDESLNRVPGVFVQNSGNFAQDTRVQIRGFGTRAAFGVREVRVLLDGLPETLPDGQTQLDEIDLDAIERIEVVRGASGALYGNASGGVIQLFTADPPPGPTARTRLEGGSFGLNKYTIQTGTSDRHASFNVHASQLQLDGYRNHSESRVTTINGKLELAKLEHTRITTLIDGVDSPKADDPGALTRAETKADPQAANPANVRFDAGERVQQGRVGWLIDHDNGANRMVVYGYLLYRDFENSLSFASGGIVTFNRFSPGGGARYSRDFSLLGLAQTTNAGVDVQWQDDNRRRYDNDLGERGPLNLDQREQVLGVGPYLLHVIDLTDQVELSAGARYDRVRYDVDVHYDATGNDNSGSTSFDKWSPTASLRYSPRTWLTWFADVGTTFQVPTTTELAVADRAGLDTRLKPQTAISYETGARLEHGPDVTGGLSTFFIDIDDELIPYESAPGRTEFRNAGKSRRYGVEVDWQAQLLQPLRWSGAFTWIDARYRDYKLSDLPEANFDGNDEPGIPPWQLYLELLYRHRSGAFAGLEGFVVENYFVDDANTAKSRSYQLLNLRLGWELNWRQLELSPFIAVNNLTNCFYDGTVRINARGGRYYEPAPGLNLVGGINLTAAL